MKEALADGFEQRLCGFDVSVGAAGYDEKLGGGGGVRTPKDGGGDIALAVLGMPGRSAVGGGDGDRAQRDVQRCRSKAGEQAVVARENGVKRCVV